MTISLQKTLQGVVFLHGSAWSAFGARVKGECFLHEGSVFWFGLVWQGMLLAQYTTSRELLLFAEMPDICHRKLFLTCLNDYNLCRIYSGVVFAWSAFGV